MNRVTCAAGSQQSLKPVHWSFVADVYRNDGKRFVVRADEKLTAFLEPASRFALAANSLDKLANVSETPGI